MDTEFTVKRCREILGDVAKNLSDKEIEEIKDCFIALTYLIIEQEIKKLNVKRYERSNQTTIPKS